MKKPYKYLFVDGFGTVFEPLKYDPYFNFVNMLDLSEEQSRFAKKLILTSQQTSLKWLYNHLRDKFPTLRFFPIENLVLKNIKPLQRDLDACGSLIQFEENALNLLHYCKAKIPVCLISNLAAPYARAIIKNEKIRQYFSNLVFSCCVGSSKPSAKIFNHALEITNTRPAEGLMLGDSIKDYYGANQTEVGMDAVLISPRGKDIFLPNIRKPTDLIGKYI